MMKFFEFIFASFWRFAGVFVLMTITLNGIAEIISAIFKGLALRKHGFPQSKTEKETESDETMTDRLQNLINRKNDN